VSGIDLDIPRAALLSLRKEHAVCSDTYTGPQPEQVARYLYRPGWLSNDFSLPNLRLR